MRHLQQQAQYSSNIRLTLTQMSMLRIRGNAVLAYCEITISVIDQLKWSYFHIVIDFNTGYEQSGYLG